MKKRLFFLMCILGTVNFVTAQVGILNDDGEYPIQETNLSIPVSHWSIGIKSGASNFRIPPNAIKESDRDKLMVGGFLDYTFNPFIGIGLEYDYNNYSGPYTYNNIKGNLDGVTNDLILVGSVNLSNAFAPYRSGFWHFLNIYGDGGGGVAFYRYALNNAQLKNKETLMGKLGLNAEFTLNKSFNLSLAGQYNQYDSRNMSDATAIRNCDAWIWTVGLRYKIGGKSLKHVRDINLCEYSPKPIPSMIKNTYVKGETEETLNHLKDVVEENSAMKQKIQQLQKKAENAKTVAVEKKLTTENLSLQQKLQKMEEDLKLLSTQKEGVVNLSLDNIEFKSGSNQLTSASNDILNQVAGILTSIEAWSTLMISGHTDNIGSVASNLKLSQSRALSVKRQLASKGVPASKIATSGWGESDPIATNDTPEGRQKNRRVEFEIK